VAVTSGKAGASGVPVQDAPPWDEGGWRSRAACRGDDPELFFPIGSSGRAALEQIAAAKAICIRCPVREACLRFALDTGQDYGVWGGLTEDERRTPRRRERSASLRQPANPPRVRTGTYVSATGLLRSRRAC
jgi:WhiB family transcriptional regulator, redox-sensing transcriptional regulator